MKIDPNNITDYNRTYPDLERFWLFGIFAAGKNSDWASTKVEELLEDKPDYKSPLSYLREMGGVWLRHALRGIRSGQYNRIYRAIVGSYGVDLFNCGLDDLTTIYGVGPKTARFFIVHTRKQAHHAVLDTHILRWMSSIGIPTPKTTPSGKRYLQLEQVCLKLMQENYPNLTVAEADLTIWKNQKYQTIS